MRVTASNFFVQSFLIYICCIFSVNAGVSHGTYHRSFAAAVVGICRKYRIEWLLTLTKDGNRETAIHVRPNEAREPSTGLDRRENASWRPNEHVLA